MAPPDLARWLYDGAPVAEAGIRSASPTPFTRRGALYALNAALYVRGKPGAPTPLSEKLVARLQEPGCLNELRAWLEAQREKLCQRLAPEPALAIPGPHGVALEQAIAQVDALLAFLASHATPAVLIAYLQDEQSRLSAWQADVRARLTRLRNLWREGEPDAPLTAAAWAALQADAAGEQYRAVGVRVFGYGPIKSDDPMPPLSLFHDERAVTLERDRSILQVVADYYVDPARRELIPAHLLAEFEASWRRLVENRPHRMGGYHDGVQSDATIGPTQHLLLFQIASDEAMHWCWGDVGAYYIHASSADLRRGSFGQASIVLECH